MAKYRLVFRKSVSKDLRSIANQDVARILKRMKALEDDPRPPGSEKLSGLERYRVRQGNYRIVYEVIDDQLVVIVVRIGHRKDVYKRL
ncbi:type II toxin-antitoxin system RelE/ParE family toxin [Marinobacter bryozoorum]|jgi:mRNA interferase RelE/StbE|uniref:type II toxin-antitoxin system RelE family toxin n=1 Tax=Marinobacter bryozoorum TaxID=256324 RepID=UPI00200678C1|nr:type II toxin-antitoxin system RelE/ParE family toxin [Marinobacter bryozoorum]MCK7543600.1 type II toxin-antitoxin system RelE/ParE family toxin [Marinobacter bryozoorum]